MARRRGVAADAARQQEVLRRHRAEREAAQMVDQGARTATAHLGVGLESPYLLEQENAGDLSDAAAVAAHEAAWARLEATTTSAPTLTAVTLPWPPFGTDLARYLRACGAVLSTAGATAGLRRAYTRACLRWHPDKFRQRYGHFIDPNELETVLVGVGNVASRLNAAMEEMRGEGD